jgi:opacity protein-like surface antigen
MLLRLPSAFVMLFSCAYMLIGAQIPPAPHDAGSGEPQGFPLAAVRSGGDAAAISTSGHNLFAKEIAFNLAGNANTVEYQNQVQMYIDPRDLDPGIGLPVSTKSSTSDSPPSDDSIGAMAHELTVSAGIEVTPNRKATESGTWNQESRNGPSIGVEYRFWKGLFSELNYVNTNTRLQNYAINTWTMNRLSLDAGYEHSWRAGQLSPFIKVGGGVMVLMSGYANNHTSAGLDDRAEILSGAGVRYRLSNHMSAVLEYEGRLIRNPDFSDHGWKPERNFLSEGTIGIAYSFGRAGGNSR